MIMDDNDINDYQWDNPMIINGDNHIPFFFWESELIGLRARGLKDRTSTSLNFHNLWNMWIEVLIPATGSKLFSGPPPRKQKLGDGRSALIHHLRQRFQDVSKFEFESYACGIYTPWNPQVIRNRSDGIYQLNASTKPALQSNSNVLRIRRFVLVPVSDLGLDCCCKNHRRSHLNISGRGQNLLNIYWMSHFSISHLSHLGFAQPKRGNSGVDSDSDPERSGPPPAAVAPVAPVEVQPEALVERTEAMGESPGCCFSWGRSPRSPKIFPKFCWNWGHLQGWDVDIFWRSRENLVVTKDGFESLVKK